MIIILRERNIQGAGRRRARGNPHTGCGAFARAGFKHHWERLHCVSPGKALPGRGVPVSCRG